VALRSSHGLPKPRMAMLRASSCLGLLRYSELDHRFAEQALSAARKKKERNLPREFFFFVFNFSNWVRGYPYHPARIGAAARRFLLASSTPAHPQTCAQRLGTRSAKWDPKTQRGFWRALGSQVPGD
jgi:hypothetical protein